MNPFILRAASIIADWWNDLSNAEQHSYLNKHPGSRKKRGRSPAPVKSADLLQAEENERRYGKKK